MPRISQQKVSSLAVEDIWNLNQAFTYFIDQTYLIHVDSFISTLTPIVADCSNHQYRLGKTIFLAVRNLLPILRAKPDNKNQCSKEALQHGTATVGSSRHGNRVSCRGDLGVGKPNSTL